ncbi:formyltransferase family protein [Pedobacter sp. JCM 36344]|uniref:formyltransferase family protein n=1 Tax=Pedobacter sp. JCM 36344 TaxID=3374280 RepID=UPI0039798963
MKIGFYVSRTATRLKKFLKVVELQHLEIVEKIDFVVTDNLDDGELEHLCNSLSIKFIYLSLSNIKSKNLYSSDFVCSIMEQRTTNYLFIYCDSIIKGDILKKFPNRIVNFHPSLLPSHKGLLAIDQALKDKTFLLGNTAHFVDAGIDTGPVIMQSIFPSAHFTHYNQVLDLQIPMLIQLFYWFSDNRIVVSDNNTVLVERAVYHIDTFIPNLEISNRNAYSVT